MTIEFEHVDKRYRGHAALDDVSFRCDPGTITAFCGPNGAGKSTALRILTGVARADAGRALIDGMAIAQHDEPVRVVGTLLDASAVHPGRTVAETVRLTASVAGLPRGRADECIEEVGLSDVRRRRVGLLSLGMRQRLGLANAIVGHPRVLVLDEPSNGLDPIGMRWLDGRLRDFADAGGTVLLSTHHLDAVERIADRAVVISRGRIVADGAVEKLRWSERCRVAGADNEQLVDALAGAGIASRLDGADLLVDRGAAEIGRFAAARGIPLVRLGEERAALADLFEGVASPEFDGSRA